MRISQFIHWMYLSVRPYATDSKASAFPPQNGHGFSTVLDISIQLLPRLEDIEYEGATAFAAEMHPVLFVALEFCLGAVVRPTFGATACLPIVHNGSFRLYPETAFPQSETQQINVSGISSRKDPSHRIQSFGFWFFHEGATWIVAHYRFDSKRVPLRRK